MTYAPIYFHAAARGARLGPAVAATLISASESNTTTISFRSRRFSVSGQLAAKPSFGMARRQYAAQTALLLYILFHFKQTAEPA